MMDNRFLHELNQFKKFMSQDKIGDLFVRRIDDFGIELSRDRVRREQRHDLTLMAICHGDEIGGIIVLNKLWEMIGSGEVTPNINIVLLLGNVEAALKGKRYLDRDLNRTFGYRSDSVLESKRAQALESIIGRSRFLLDIHQTIEPTKSPFFVFKYSDPAVRFAHFISADYPIVTYRNTSFSAMDGMTSGEFSFKVSCVSVSLEIGQKGFSADSISTGLNTCINAIRTVEKWNSAPGQPIVNMNSMFTWEHIELYPNEYVKLVPNLKNFDPVSSGQLIGETESNKKLIVPTDGLLLFPKYIDKGAQKPMELYRIINKVQYMSE